MENDAYYPESLYRPTAAKEFFKETSSIHAHGRLAVGYGDGCGTPPQVSKLKADET
jgi:hypothetical protein